MAEAAHELQAQKKEVPPQQYLQFQVLDQLILREHNLNKLKNMASNLMKRA